MAAVREYGEPLVEDPDRVGSVDKLGVDETSYLAANREHPTIYATAMIDLDRSIVIDLIEGNAGADLGEWLDAQSEAWLAGISVVATDLAQSYRSGLAGRLDHATRVADPFHVVRVANRCLDKVRRRVQNETLGHRGRQTDPLYRSRKLMTLAHERLDDTANAKLVGLLEAGDPKGEVRNAWHAKEVIRSIYAIDDPELAAEFVTQLGIDLQDESCPPEIRRLGRTVNKWRHQIAAWHQARFTNGPTEAVIIWSPVGGVFDVVDEGCWGRGGRVLWSDVVMVVEEAARVG